MNDNKMNLNKWKLETELSVLIELSKNLLNRLEEIQERITEIEEELEDEQ